MRISDWSSTCARPICQPGGERVALDLHGGGLGRCPDPALWIGGPAGAAALLGRLSHSTNLSISTASAAIARAAGLHSLTSDTSRPDRAVDRKRVMWAKSVSVRVELGGCWFIKT